VTQELFESGIRARACSPEALRLTFWYVTSRPAKCGGFRVVLLPPRLARARLHALLRGGSLRGGSRRFDHDRMDRPGSFGSPLPIDGTGARPSLGRYLRTLGRRARESTEATGSVPAHHRSSAAVGI
jgi:hypothetical protein